MHLCSNTLSPPISTPAPRLERGILHPTDLWKFAKQEKGSPWAHYQKTKSPELSEANAAAATPLH